MNDSLWTLDPRITAAPLEGDRSIFQRDHLRPRCPHCYGRLRPGRLLCGWDPAVRSPWTVHKDCEQEWLERDPVPVVEALAAYSVAMRPGEGVEPYLSFTMRRLRAMKVEFPVFDQDVA